MLWFSWATFPLRYYCGDELSWQREFQMSYVEECFTSSRKSEKVNEVRVMEQMESRGDYERVARSLFIQEKDKCHYVIVLLPKYLT